MSRRRILFTLFLTILIPVAGILYLRHPTVLLGGFTFLHSPGQQPLSPMASPDRHVIVVGAGLAGLSAAVSALRAGAPSVLLLERAAKPGGNSIKASSGINGAPTRFQPRGPGGAEDTFFYADTLRSAGKRLSLASAAEQPRREALIGLLTNRSRAAVEFLTGDAGVDLSVVAQLGGHSFPRTHRGGGKTPPGAAIVNALLGKLQEDPRFELRTGCEVTELLVSTDSQQQKTVTGVEYRAADPGSPGDAALHTLHGPVVFATGGFAGDADGLLARYRPDLAGMPSTNEPRPGAHGLLATGAGAALVDMDSVQIHPTGFVDPAHPAAPLKFLAAEILRGEGGILLHAGRRFVNEMETREHVSNVIMALPPLPDSRMDGTDVSGGPSPGPSPRQWDVQIFLDPGACEAAAPHVAFYIWKGLVVKKKVRDLDETTRQTLRDYSAVVAGQRQDEFGRKAFGHWKLKGDISEEEEDQEVCIGNVTPIVHFTMGGVVINEKSQVLTSSLSSQQQLPVGGLWAAGEVTGGIHGDNRLGGSSLLECVVFGLIAGEQAATSTS